MGGKSYSLEKIIEEVKSTRYYTTKSLNGIFIDIIQGMGVLPESLKCDNNRYVFSQKGHDFWVEVLSHYTEEPYTLIRSRNYEKLPFEVTRNFMTMVVETMTNAKKSSDEIQKVLIEIDNFVGYSERSILEKCSGMVEQFIISCTKELFSHSYLLWSDRCHILEYMRRICLPQGLNQIFQNILSVADYFEENRLNEARESTNCTDSHLADIILTADKDADFGFVFDSDLCEMISQLKDAEIPQTKGSISKENQIVTLIEKRRQKYRKKADKSLNLSPETRRSYNIAKHKPSKQLLEAALEELNFND